MAFLMVAARNPANGTLTMLAPVKSDASSRTVMLPAIDQSIFPVAALSLGRASGSFAQANDDPVYVFLIAILPSVLVQDFDSKYQPGADDWDFPVTSMALLPFLTPTRTAPDAMLPEYGMVATSLWYYVNKRTAGGAPLHGSTQLQAGEPLSSRGGIRWSALADASVTTLFSKGALVYDEWRDQLEMEPVEFALSQFQAIKVLFYQQYPNPLPDLHRQSRGGRGRAARRPSDHRKPYGHHHDRGNHGHRVVHLHQRGRRELPRP